MTEGHADHEPTYGFIAICTPHSDGSWTIVVTRGDTGAKELARIYRYKFTFSDVAFTEGKARKKARQMLAKIRKHVARYEHRNPFEVS